MSKNTTPLDNETAELIRAAKDVQADLAPGITTMAKAWKSIIKKPSIGTSRLLNKIMQRHNLIWQCVTSLEPEPKSIMFLKQKKHGKIRQWIFPCLCFIEEQRSETEVAFTGGYFFDKLFGGLSCNLIRNLFQFFFNYLQAFFFGVA